MKILYISQELLTWDISVSSSTIGDKWNVTRPYEIISHSQTLINEKASDFNLSDAIANLKRALNHRLQLIESFYNLKSVKFTGMPKGHLELLEEYGLAKPYVIKKLLEIRNKIEHRDAKPPKKERCKELLDITWYFLKSTDRLIYYIANDFELDPNIPLGLPEKYGCTLRVNYSKKKIELSGWVPNTYVFKQKQDNLLKIICSTMHDGSYWANKDKYHEDKTKDDIWLIGNLSIDENQRRIILKKCFEAY